MKYITFKELSPKRDHPKMDEYIDKLPYTHKQTVINFLLNGGQIQLVQLSRLKDIFTGDIIPYEVMVMSDGDYYWPNYLAWYVEKYNLRMPEDFEKYILVKMKE